MARAAVKKKVAPILPVRVLTGELQVGLVDEGGRLQRHPDRGPHHLRPGNALQLGVQLSVESLAGILVAIPHRAE